MQFCDFDACADGRVREEIARLRERAILSPEQADAVEPERIEAFFQSDLYRKHMQTGELRREFKFSSHRSGGGPLPWKPRGQRRKYCCKVSWTA